jgi:hypothetical protein
MAPAESTEPTDTSHSTDSVELAKYLWEEYKYRHDLIWRLLFRVTSVAALLSIAPFTINDLIREAVGVWVKFLPALAIGLVGVSWILLWDEFRLFRPVDRQYVKVQKTAVGRGYGSRGVSITLS